MWTSLVIGHLVMFSATYKHFIFNLPYADTSLKRTLFLVMIRLYIIVKRSDNPTILYKVENCANKQFKSGKSSISFLTLIHAEHEEFTLKSAPTGTCSSSASVISPSTWSSSSSDDNRVTPRDARATTNVL